ncbi:MAG: SseB family protein [Lachnospiraceae bacterium]|nr:SseB family protein [Lachnospiraceae bacterium]
MKKNANSMEMLEIDNKKLEEEITVFKKDPGNKDHVVSLMASIRTARLLLPAKFPSDLSDEIKGMIKNRIKIPKEKMPPLYPVLEQNQQGELYVAVYTSKKHITNPQDYPVIINTNFEQVTRIAGDKKLNIRGVIVNPRTDKLTLHPQFLDAVGRMSEKVNNQTDGVREVKMTRGEFEAFARKNVEHTALVKAAFSDSATFMQQLDEMRESLIYGYYKQPYGDKITCPYKEDQFDVMVLDIRDDCRIASVVVPLPKGMTGCYHLCFVYDPNTEVVRYFIFEKQAEEEVAMVKEVQPDGSESLIGEAPVAGSEMSFVLDHLDTEA